MAKSFEQRSIHEAKWSRTDGTSASLRNRFVRKERFFIRQLDGRRGRVLDLGCGGGWRLYTRVGPVVGVDLSHRALRNAATIYSGAVQADLAKLPFATGSFDIVVSSDVLGHIRLEQKDAVVAEIHRVLRPGGRTIHYVEADGDDPFMSFAKRDRALYYRYVVEPEGHVGLEKPAAITCRFRRAGFSPLYEIPSYRALTYVGRFVQYFDNEYAAKALWLRVLVSVSKALAGFRFAEVLTNLFLAALMEIGDRVLPESWAGGVLLAYERDS